MIDIIFLYAFILLALLGRQGFIVGLCCAACIVFPMVTGELSLLDNAFAAVMMFGVAMLELDKRVKILLFLGGSIQFLSMLSNVYFDFELIPRSQILHNLSYYIYLIFPYVVITINSLLIYSTSRKVTIERRSKGADFNRRCGNHSC